MIKLDDYARISYLRAIVGQAQQLHAEITITLNGEEYYFEVTQSKPRGMPIIKELQNDKTADAFMEWCDKNRPELEDKEKLKEFTDKLNKYYAGNHDFLNVEKVSAFQISQFGKNKNG